MASNAATNSGEGLAGRSISSVTGLESALLEDGEPVSLEAVSEMTDAVSSDDSPVVVSNRSSSKVTLLFCLLWLFFPNCVASLLLIPSLQTN